MLFAGDSAIVPHCVGDIQESGGQDRQSCLSIWPQDQHQEN